MATFSAQRRFSTVEAHPCSRFGRILPPLGGPGAAVGAPQRLSSQSAARLLLTIPSALPSANMHAERSMPTRQKGSMIASAELCLVSFITSAHSTLTSISMRSAFDGRSASLPDKPSDAPGKAGKPSEHCGRAYRQPFNCQPSLVPPSGDKSAEPAMEASASNRLWLSLGDKGGDRLTEGLPPMP